MLAGCSSTLLSPRHNRLLTESTLTTTCHFQLPTSMNTQKLDLPCCSFPSNRPPTTLSIPGRGSESSSSSSAVVSTRTPTPTTTGSLRQSIRFPISPATVGQREIGGTHQFWEDEIEEEEELERRGVNVWYGNRRNKRAADQSFFDEESYVVAKRKKGGFVLSEEEDGLSCLWFQQNEGIDEEEEEEIPDRPFSITCGVEGEQEIRNLCFVPGRNHPWVGVPGMGMGGIGMMNHPEITEFSEGDDDETETDPQKNQPTGLNISPEQALTTTTASGGEVRYGNGSRSTHHQNPSGPVQPTTTTITTTTLIGGGGGNYPSSSSHNGTGNHNNHDEEERKGFELITLLTNCVESITTRNIPAINHYICKLGETASPNSTSPLIRLISYFTEALTLRITRAWPNLFHFTPPREFFDDEISTFTSSSTSSGGGGGVIRLLNQITPIPKFIHFTANEMILRAFEGKDKVHIIDFDIKQGLQWPTLFQSLAMRRHPPSHVRITGIGESKQELVETGERLSGFAQALNLPFKFHPVVDRLEDVRLWMLHVKGCDESVAVNCVQILHKVLYDDDGIAFRDLMGIIRSTNPTVVVVAEQESEHNDLALERRVCNSLRYYAAIFDGVDVAVAGSGGGLNLTAAAVRGKVEEMFGREIRNIIGCEGRDRFERHVGFEKWCGMIREQGWLKCLGVSEMELMQSKMLLKLHHGMEEYGIEKRISGGGEEGLCLKWIDQPLYTVSAWGRKGVDDEDVVAAAGSSSGFSHPSNTT